MPGIPLTASFSGVPAEHDGTAFEIRFHLSEEPTASSELPHGPERTVRHDGREHREGEPLAPRGRTTGGACASSRPALSDVTSAGQADDRVRHRPRGVHAPMGGNSQEGSRSAIAGPAVLSVADAEVEEAPDATLDFVVTLSKQRFTATTVAYATSDGTATAGSDYTSTSGTLTFGPLETSKSVSVPVLDDAHDEGSESLTLTLSNAAPSAVRISDATATGTISNSDPMPKAWMVRFGRTVGSQVVDALGARLAAAGDPHVTMGGMRFGVEALRSLNEDAALDEREGNAEQRAALRTMSADELLRSSAFHLSSGGASGNSARFSAWGRVSTGGFDADVDDVALDGRVTSALFGADAEWDRVMAGVMLSRSSGDGDYRLKEAMGDDGGSVESTLTGVYPYARLQMSERDLRVGHRGARLGRLDARAQCRRADEDRSLDAPRRTRSTSEPARGHAHAVSEPQVRRPVGRHGKATPRKGSSQREARAPVCACCSKANAPSPVGEKRNCSPQVRKSACASTAGTPRAAPASRPAQGFATTRDRSASKALCGRCSPTRKAATKNGARAPRCA